MKVKVVFFAKSREIVGRNQMDIEIQEGEVVSGLLSKLKSQFHELLDMQFITAVNSEYMGNDTELHDDDEVAIIPPVSGG